MTYIDIIKILDAFRNSDFKYLNISCGEVRIIIDRTGQLDVRSINDGDSAAPAAADSMVEAPPSSTEATTFTESLSADASDPSKDAKRAGLPGTETEELVDVLAPVVGTFYRASEPGADPYVDVGDHVALGDTLGLVEVMKVFNSVAAPCPGEVVEILAENEAFVEFEEVVIRIRPVSPE